MIFLKNHRVEMAVPILDNIHGFYIISKETFRFFQRLITSLVSLYSRTKNDNIQFSWCGKYINN